MDVGHPLRPGRCKTLHIIIAVSSHNVVLMSSSSSVKS